MGSVDTGSGEITTLEIIEVNNKSYTSKMEAPKFTSTSTRHYKVKDGVCYIHMSESLIEAGERKFRDFTTYKPAKRCYIRINEMPYYQKYEMVRRDPSGNILKNKQLEHKYNILGEETIDTPAGKYETEIIEIVREKGKNIVWRSKDNQMIKHIRKLNNKPDKEVVIFKARSR